MLREQPAICLFAKPGITYAIGITYVLQQFTKFYSLLKVEFISVYMQRSPVKDWFSGVSSDFCWVWVNLVAVMLCTLGLLAFQLLEDSLSPLPVSLEDAGTTEACYHLLPRCFVVYLKSGGCVQVSYNNHAYLLSHFVNLILQFLFWWINPCVGDLWVPVGSFHGSVMETIEFEDRKQSSLKSKAEPNKLLSLFFLWIPPQFSAWNKYSTEKGVCVSVIKQEIPESSCDLSSYYAGRSFFPKDKSWLSPHPRRLSGSSTINTPTHLAPIQTRNKLAPLPRRAVLCVSQFCLLALDFGPQGIWGEF